MKQEFPVPMPDDMQRYIVENTARMIVKSGMCLDDAVSDAVGFAVFNELWEPYTGEYATIPSIMQVEGQFASEEIGKAVRDAVAARLLEKSTLDHVVSICGTALLYQTDWGSATDRVVEQLKRAIAAPTREFRTEAVRLLEDENFRLAEKLNHARQLLRSLAMLGGEQEPMEKGLQPPPPGDNRLLTYVFEDFPSPS